MKHLFRLAVIMFSLFIVAACGGQAEPQGNISDMALSTFSMETKELITIHSNDEEVSEKKEAVEENNLDEDTDSAVTMPSKNNNNEASSANVSGSNRSTSPTSDANQSSSTSDSTSSQTMKPKQSAVPKKKEGTKNENIPTPTPKSTVTVSIESPSDLNGPNLTLTQVEITDGATAFSATLSALNSKGISIDYTGSGATVYVKGIGGLGEFDAGPLSGWNIYVEGVMIPRSSDTQEVLNGYSIHWKYTKNFSEN